MRTLTQYAAVAPANLSTLFRAYYILCLLTKAHEPQHLVAFLPKRASHNQSPFAQEAVKVVTDQVHVRT